MIVLRLGRSDYFKSDADLQFRWYLQKAGRDVAERYLAAVIDTLQQLAAQPGMGRLRGFRHPDLKGLRSFRVVKPFNVHVIFYRHTDTELIAERIMHGKRDLPRRLRQPPGEGAVPL